MAWWYILHVGVKRRQQIAQFSLQHYGPLRRAAVHYHQSVLLREVLDFVEVFLTSSVLFL
jgi:hypothetical protein